MKKTYMKPESKAIEILKENFIATSPETTNIGIGGELTDEYD